MKWTTRHDRELVRLWPDLSIPEIEEQIGFKARTIRDHARRLGLPKKSTCNRRYTPIPKAAIAGLVTRGYGITQIAARLGVSRNTLTKQMKVRMPTIYQRVISDYGYRARDTRRRNKEQNNDTRTT